MWSPKALAMESAGETNWPFVSSQRLMLMQCCKSVENSYLSIVTTQLRFFGSSNFSFTLGTVVILTDNRTTHPAAGTEVSSLLMYTMHLGQLG